MGNVETSIETHFESDEENTEIEDPSIVETHMFQQRPSSNQQGAALHLEEHTISSVVTLRGLVIGYPNVGKTCFLRHLRGEDPFQTNPQGMNTKKKLMALTPWRLSTNETIQLHILEQDSSDTPSSLLQKIAIRGWIHPTTTATTTTTTTTSKIQQETDFLILIVDPRRMQTLDYARAFLQTLQQQASMNKHHNFVFSLCILINFMDVLHSSSSTSSSSSSSEDSALLFTREQVLEMVQQQFIGDGGDNNDDEKTYHPIPIFIFETSMRCYSQLKPLLHDFLSIPYLQRKEFHLRQSADRIQQECKLQTQQLASLSLQKTCFPKDEEQKRQVLPRPTSYTMNLESSPKLGIIDTVVQDEKDDEKEEEDPLTTMDQIKVIPTSGVDLEQFLESTWSSDDDTPIPVTKPTSSNKQRNPVDVVVYQSEDESDQDSTQQYNMETRNQEQDSMNGMKKKKKKKNDDDDNDNSDDDAKQLDHRWTRKVDPVTLNKKTKSEERIYISSSSSSDDDFMVHESQNVHISSGTKIYTSRRSRKEVKDDRNVDPNTMTIPSSISPNSAERERAIATAIQEATQSLENETKIERRKIKNDIMKEEEDDSKRIKKKKKKKKSKE